MKMLKELKRMRRKYGAGFMAIATVFFMLSGELIAFVNPQAAMAAEKSRKIRDEYYTDIIEETHYINTGDFITADYDELNNLEIIDQNVKKSYTVYEYSDEPTNYSVNVPISLY